MPQPVIADDDLEEPVARATGRPARRRRLWPLLASVGGVVLVGSGLGWYFGSQWLEDQYFVGAKGDAIVVFQGVKTNLGPIELFNVAQSTTDSISALGAFQQGQVRDGIPVASVDAGLKKIAELKTSAQKPDGKDKQTPQPSTTATPEPTK